MKRTSILLITTFALAHCLEIITVTVGPDGNQFYPSQIYAPSNTTLSFQLPSNFFSIVQSTFDKPCTPLPGGFNSGFSGGNLDPSVWDWTILDDTESIWFFYQNTLQPTPCKEGIVGVINSPSTSQYMEFRQIANLYQSNSALLPWLPTNTDGSILTTSMSDPAISSSPLSQLSPTSNFDPMTSTIDPAMTSSQVPQPLSTNDPAISSSSSLSQLLPTSSLIPTSFASNPTASSFSPLPQLLPTSSTPLPTRSPAQRNVGAIVAGTVVGAFAGIVALVVLANVAVILFRRWRDNETYENIPVQAPPAPPPAVPEKEPREDAQAVPSGSVEMTQVPGGESRIYQPIQSNGIESIPETRSAAMRPSSTQSVTVPAPALRRSIRSRPQSQVDTSARCQLLLSSDPFANVARPSSADAVDDRQRLPQQHQQLSRQRTPSIRRSRHRQSRADSMSTPMIPENQPSIPEQDIEFITQEVSSLIMTDPAPADRPSSHVTYSSPSIGQRSPTLGFSRKSPTINFRKSPTLNFARPSVSLTRSMSRGSSMEGG